jgi:hypothetical protein
MFGAQIFYLQFIKPERFMKKVILAILVLAIALFVALPNLAWAQEDVITLEDVVQSAGQWARENLDEEALRSLQNADQEKVRQFFDAIHKQFHGEYIIDLAQLRDGARLVLPLLESREETMPYAVWLKTRMDYFETADELRLLIRLRQQRHLVTPSRVGLRSQSPNGLR